MKLRKFFEVRGVYVNKWAIYELSDEQCERFGKRYAVSCGVFTEDSIEVNGEDNLLGWLDTSRHEGFFETYNEAVMHIKLIDASAKINKLENAVIKLEAIVDNSHIDDWTADLL